MGFSVKKALPAAGFAAMGLASSWLALRAVESVDWSELTYRWPAGRCRELDHCGVPWYGVALFVSILLLPSAVHAVAGWRLAATGASVRRFGLTALVLFVGTALFFVVARLASGVP